MFNVADILFHFIGGQKPAAALIELVWIRACSNGEVAAQRGINGTKTVFWAEGFNILQNIEDRMSMQQGNIRVRTRDPVQLRSVVKSNDKVKKKNEDDQVPDLSYYDDSDDESYDESDREDGEGQGIENVTRTHDHLVNRVQLRKGSLNDRCISARVTSMDKSLIQSTDDEHPSNNAHGGDCGRCSC